MVPWDTQIIDSDFHVWVSSQLDFLAVRSDNCKDFAVVVLVEPFKDNEGCSRPLKIDERVFLIVHFDFVGQVPFAELALQFRKSIDWHQPILLPSYFTLDPCLQALEMNVLAWTFAVTWRNQILVIFSFYQANSTDLVHWIPCIQIYLSFWEYRLE